MAITSVDTALAQYNANLDWNTDRTKAQAALEAVRYLSLNQPKVMTIEGQTVVKDEVALADEKAKLEYVLGAAQPRANGRRRRLISDMA